MLSPQLIKIAHSKCSCLLWLGRWHRRERQREVCWDVAWIKNSQNKASLILCSEESREHPLWEGPGCWLWTLPHWPMPWESHDCLLSFLLYSLSLCYVPGTKLIAFLMLSNVRWGIILLLSFQRWENQGLELINAFPKVTQIREILALILSSNVHDLYH